jgi:hypothetical protein
MSDEQTPGSEPQRDTRGRYVKGFSGNPAGKPAGIMSEAARAAAGLLNASAPVLVSKAIELALLGKSGPLKYCLDRIIAPQKDQPVIFEAPEGDRPGEAPDFAGMMATVAAAAAEGSITPSQAATLCQAFADHARGLETQQRVEQQRLAADAPAVWNRMQLRACVALADGVREISEEAGEVDDRVPPLCLPIMRTGRRALIELAKIEDHAAQMLADEAFVVEHPMPEDHPRHPIAAEMAELWHKLSEYLDNHMYRLEPQIEERFAARQAAGEPDPIYRAWIFQPLEVRAARLARKSPEST